VNHKTFDENVYILLSIKLFLLKTIVNSGFLKFSWIRESIVLLIKTFYKPDGKGEH